MKGRTSSLVGLCLVLVLASSCGRNGSHLDTSLPIDKRVDLLVSKMTVEEKAAQLCYIINADRYILDSQGNIDEAKVLEAFPEGVGSVSFGQVRMPMDRAIVLNNALQKIMVEKTRLGIPCMFIGEGLHGFMAVGATSFPQAIALGCTWDTSLIEQVFYRSGPRDAGPGIPSGVVAGGGSGPGTAMGQNRGRPTRRIPI
jgi:hypothetical protein